METQAVIEIKDLSRNFGAVKAVNSLTFDVNPGEIFGIVGPDGAGKSTLLRMMAAILEPDAGSIHMNGIDIFKNPYRIKENLAYMPQRFGLYEDLTVEENILFFGRLFSVPHSAMKAQMDRLYNFSRLRPFKERLAGKLSGGMKQKLGLACCLIHKPGIILLDEPTNGVDPVSRREFWKILYDLLSDGVTIIVSTAYLDEAERCNRVAMMYEGRFEKIGRPEDIKAGMDRKFVELRTSDPRKAEAVLRNVPEFRNVILTGTNLKLFTGDVEGSRRKITALMQGTGIKIISYKHRLPALEDCFMEIVSARGK